MKKIILFVILSTTGLFVNAQDRYDYYKMYDLEGGWYKKLRGEEWLANSHKWLNFYGIQIAAGNKVRATLSASGSWYFAAPSSGYGDGIFNTINSRLKTWSDVAIGTDKSFSARSYLISDLATNNTVYGMLGLGRNSDPTLKVLSNSWLRIGSKSAIAMWANDNVSSDDSPHVLLENDGTFNVRYNLHALIGTGDLYLKGGRNGDPTIRTSQPKWLRLGSKTAIAMWANDSVESNDSPHLLLENNGTFNVRNNLHALVGTGDLYLKGGRNGDPTILTSQSKWLRIGSKTAIAMWANDSVESNDSPHLLLENNGTFNVRNNLHALVGTGDLYLKGGRNGDPTIVTSQSKWLRIGGTSGVFLWGNANAETNDNPTLSIVGSNVGIGTGTNIPEYKLDIKGGGMRVSADNIEVLFSTSAGSEGGWIGTKSNHPLYLGANNSHAILIDAAQKVYLGLGADEMVKITADLKNKYDLFVDKGILSEDYAIAPTSTWSDFVFSKEYILPSLSYVENFIAENKHLPDVPSATQVAIEGYSQHEMNKTLLEKIEGLTLYIIEQQKQINELKLQLQQGSSNKKIR